MQVDNIRKKTNISVDLAKLNTENKNGYHTFPVDVRLPENVKLLAIDPTEVEIVFKKSTP